MKVSNRAYVIRCISFVVCIALYSWLGAQDIYIVNPFVQPNDSTLNWYGSGDANGDDTLAWDDVTRMQELIDGTFTDPDDRRLYDRADLNGDQIVDQSDYDIMVQHFQERAPRDPAFYWANLTADEKESWLQKMLAIDKTNEAEWDGQIPLWDCNNYSHQLMINVHGFSDSRDIDSLNREHTYSWDNNGRFNLPLLSAYLIDYEPFLGAHEMNTIIIEDKFMGWYNQSAVEPQWDLVGVQPGEGYIMGENTDYYIQGIPITGILEFSSGPYASFLFYAKYHIQDKVPDEGEIRSNFNSYNVHLLTEKPAQSQKITTNLDIGMIYEVSPVFNVEITDPNFKFSWVSDGISKLGLRDGYNSEITFNLTEGQHNILFYARDIFDRDTLITQSLTIQDLYAPRINFLSPSQGMVYGSSPPVEISIDEPNFEYAIFSLDNRLSWTGFTLDTVFTPALEFGNHTIIVQAEDKYGNTSVDSVSFTIADLDAPATPTGLVGTNITETSVHLEWNASSDNIGIAGYKVYLDNQPTDTCNSNSHTLLDLGPNTTYQVSVSAYDEVGNESARSNTISVTTLDPSVGLVEYVGIGNVKIYPNPTDYLLYVETGNIGSCLITISAMNGQIIIEQEITEPIHQIDLSPFQKGIYCITIRSEDFVTTKKVIKL